MSASQCGRDPEVLRANLAAKVSRVEPRHSTTRRGTPTSGQIGRPYLMVNYKSNLIGWVLKQGSKEDYGPVLLEPKW
jgi:hypothetical protein